MTKEEILIIKVPFMLSHSKEKAWREKFEKEKESGVILLPPGFEVIVAPKDVIFGLESEEV